MISGLNLGARFMSWAQKAGNGKASAASSSIAPVSEEIVEAMPGTRPFGQTRCTESRHGLDWKIHQVPSG